MRKLCLFLAASTWIVGSSLACAAELDTKLQAQWQRFNDARALGLARLVNHRLPVTRREWESVLAVSPAFSADDLKQLRTRQSNRAEAARVYDDHVSALDLKRLRAMGEQKVQDFCEDLPKGGLLHVHPWGTLSQTGLQQVFQLVNPTLVPRHLHDSLKDPKASSYLYPAELAYLDLLAKRYGDSIPYSKLSPAEQVEFRQLFFLSSGTHEFGRFQAVFVLIYELFLAHPAVDASPLMYADFFARAKAEKVSYTELSELIPLNAVAFKQLDRLAIQTQQQYGVTARWLAAFMRTKSPHDLAIDAAKLLALPQSAAVIGINLVADETNTPTLEHAQTLYLPLLAAALEGKTALRLGIHAGELGDGRNVRDALVLGAERIGHAVDMDADPVTVEYAALNRVPIEVNLTSNLRLRAVKTLTEHPFLKFLRLGMRVSLSTDDEGILGTDINHECMLAIENTDINYEELRRMNINSIETAFSTPNVTKPLLQRLNDDLTQFEARWKSRIK